jgi:hypothetical protein
MAEYWRDLELGEEKQIGDRFMSDGEWHTITEAHLEIESLRTVCPATRPMQRKAECVPPVENGLNRFGLDTSYFRNAINRELNRGLADYTPDELARVLARLSVTASSQVIFEAEFQRRNASDTRCPSQNPQGTHTDEGVVRNAVPPPGGQYCHYIQPNVL